MNKMRNIVALAALATGCAGLWGIRQPDAKARSQAELERQLVDLERVPGVEQSFVLVRRTLAAIDRGRLPAPVDPRATLEASLGRNPNFKVSSAATLITARFFDFETEPPRPDSPAEAREYLAALDDAGLGARVLGEQKWAAAIKERSDRVRELLRQLEDR